MKAVRRPQFWFKLTMWLLSFVITGFLIQLGGLIMSDLPTAGERVSRDDFVNAEQLNKVDAELGALDEAIEINRNAYDDARFVFDSRKLDYQTQKTNFESWIKTRNATRSDDENPEVLKRVKIIEELKSEERKALRVVEELNQESSQQEKSLNDLRSKRHQIVSAAEAPYQKAKKAEVLKVFLLRLAITLPLLLISGWLIFKKRSSKYWPVYRGFVIFSLFAFFVELVPYLPSYGGYVRYIVGIGMALIFAHFMIKWMDKYLKNKKHEQEKSETEKRMQIEYEDGVKKISSGVCPSCDRQFIVKKTRSNKDEPKVEMDYCVHCGFCLYDKCNNCGTRENSFFPFCGSCGTATNTKAAEPAELVSG